MSALSDSLITPPGSPSPSPPSSSSSSRIVSMTKQVVKKLEEKESRRKEKKRFSSNGSVASMASLSSQSIASVSIKTSVLNVSRNRPISALETESAAVEVFHDEEDGSKNTAELGAGTGIELPALHSITNGISRPKRAPALDEDELSVASNDTRHHVDLLFSSSLSHADMEICQRLDQEYERALEEREIGYNARYASVRQSACVSILFMVCFLSGGTAFFTTQAGWDVRDALFFSIYTMTTVGYGVQQSVPNHTEFQLFVMFYIFTGIATLTILVAQVYQCIALEASRAQHLRDRAEIMRKGTTTPATGRTSIFSSANKTNTAATANTTNTATNSSLEMQDDVTPNRGDVCVHSFFRNYDRFKRYFSESELGRGLSVLFPFAGLILIGAVVVGPMEGWTVVESLYFSCVSLTTVGYGLYVPQNPIAIYFCIFWLPFSVGFMSLFLGNVASFYIRLSDKNIHRLERHMRRRIQKAKEDAEQMQQLSLQEDPEGGHNHNHNNTSNKKKTRGDFEMLGETDVTSRNERRRDAILANSARKQDEKESQTMQTMRDILRTVKLNVSNVLDDEPEPQWVSSSQSTTASLSSEAAQSRKPPFALRVLVQERFAEIIATDIAGFQSHMDIQDNTLSVSIDSLKETADKWGVPRRARKAFRAVAFEALYFVGEHGLITRGPDALYDLTPFEFHGLFSPLLAAMGDADAMQLWLADTRVLADVDLRMSPRPERRIKRLSNERGTAAAVPAPLPNPIV